MKIIQKKQGGVGALGGVLSDSRHIEYFIFFSDLLENTPPHPTQATQDQKRLPPRRRARRNKLKTVNRMILL